MPKVVVSIPELGVTRKGIETEKEIYVIALVADLRDSGSREQTFTAAYNETLPNIMPELAGMDALNWVLVSVSNTFERIRDDQPLSLSGSGIVLYPNLDPNGMLALHLVIVESDRGRRNLGKVLSGILDSKEIKNVVTLLSAGVSQVLIGQLMNTLISAIPGVLKKNKDDALFSHNHSGFDFDDYGVLPTTGGPKISNFKIGNDRAYCTLRVRVNEQPAEPRKREAAAEPC